MYKLIDIINNTSLDDLIIDTWNLEHIGIEASTIIRHKGYFDIHTSYQFEYSWTGRITFTEALRLLNNYYLKSIKLHESYQQIIQNIYAQRGIILDKFFARGRVLNNLSSQCNTNQLEETMKIINQNLK